MSEINYQALREAAEKAAWGDWDSYKPHRGARGYEVRLSSQAIAQHVLKNNAEFIAAFNPKVALALLDERERNQQYIKSRDQENEEIALTVGKLRVELEAADNNLIDSECHVAELEEALRDKQALLEAAENRIAELESLTAQQLPQKALAVPDEMTPKQASRSYCGEVRGYRDGWNDCRAAMLQCSEPETDNTNQQFESLSRGDKMNRQIALRDIIKAIVILKPGATMAVIQRMIWTKTPSATIGTALHCIVEQGLFTTRRVENKGRPGFKCNAYYPTKKLLDSFTVTSEIGLTDADLNPGKVKRKHNTVFESCKQSPATKRILWFYGCGELPEVEVR